MANYYTTYNPKLNSDVSDWLSLLSSNIKYKMVKLMLSSAFITSSRDFKLDIGWFRPHHF